jgi:hypothetical protein
MVIGCHLTRVGADVGAKSIYFPKEENRMARRILFVLVLVLSVALTACGDEPAKAPMTLSKLAVFSGAKESSNPALTAASAAVIDAMPKDTVKGSESKAYDVPAGTKWDALKSFYGPAIEKEGFSSIDSGDNYGAWSHTSPMQGFYLIYVPAANGYVLVIANLK